MPTERFRFRDDVLRGAAAHTRRRFATTLAVTASIVAAVWAVALRAQGAGWGTLTFSLALLLALAAFSIRRRMRRLYARWESFEIALDEDAIARQVTGFAPLRIARADVESVGERADGLVVRGRGGAVLIAPRDLEGYDRLREALAGWAPAAPATGGR